MTLQIPSTKSTPLIELNKDSLVQRIEGISIPIDAFDFYKPINAFLSDPETTFKPETEFRFRLNYYNTSSSKALYQLLQKIKELKAKQGSIKIVWEYEDDNEFMLESGQEFADLLECKFEFEKLN